MASTNFIDGATKIMASWLNQINGHVFNNTPITGVTVHPASVIANTPAGTVAATTVQGAIDELDATITTLDGAKAELAGSASQVFSVSPATEAGHAVPLAQTVGKNFIINGGCRVPQRGPGVAVSAVDMYGQVDRHIVLITGGTGISGNILQFNTVATTTGFGVGVYNTSWTTGQFTVKHRIEALNSASLNTKQVTFSCFVYQNTGGSRNFTINIARPTTTADTFSAQTSISTSSAIPVASGVLTKISYTATLGASDATLGLQIQVIDSVANTVTSKNYYVGDLQLEASPVATMFKSESYTRTLAECQRYLPCLDASASATTKIGTGYSYSTSVSIIDLTFPVTARVAPTGISGSSITTPSQINTANGAGTQAAATAVALTFAGVNGVELSITTTGTPLTVGQGSYARFNTTSGKILFEGCEL